MNTHGLTDIELASYIMLIFAALNIFGILGACVYEYIRDRLDKRGKQ